MNYVVKLRCRTALSNFIVKLRCQTSLLNFVAGLFLATAVIPATGRNNDEIMRAMHDELVRNMMELRLDGLATPYHIEYTLTKRHRLGAHAILGIVDDIDTASTATVTVRVRVGTPKFDNTNFFDVSLGFFGSSDDEEAFRNRRVPLDVSYEALRRELWLATDACFKQAVEIYAKKSAVVKNRMRTDTTWDFALMPGYTSEETSQSSITSNIDHIRTVVERVSAAFRNAKHVQASRVGMEFVPEETFYVNSEGRRMHKVETFTGLEIVATTQADDGMPITKTYAVYGTSPKDLPSADSLVRAAEGMVRMLDVMRTAPTIEPYSGPVLFEGQAAAQVLAQEFAPNLVAQRQPMSESGFSTNDRSMAFQNKIGARVLPEWLSMKDLPSLKSLQGTAVAGHYTVDDEGIPAQDVNVVEKGYLKALLSSRIPTRRVRATNGHQRGGGAMFSVLKLDAEKSKNVMSSADLRKKLLKLVKDRELDYGIIVREITDQNIMMTGLFPLLQGDLPMSSQGTLPLVEVVKLYPDGREEVIRGVEGAGFAPALFKDILAVGKTPTVHNFLARSVIPSFISGGSQFVISTIITPDLLFEDVEVRPREGDMPKPPKMARP